MFYFAHPFGISSPAATTTTASTSAKASNPPKASKPEPSRKPVPLPAPKYERQPSKTEIVRQRADSRDGPTKSSGGMAAAARSDKPPPKTPAAENRAKLKKTKNSHHGAGGTPGKKTVTTVANGGHRVSRTPLTVKPHAKAPRRPNAIEMDKRVTPLTPWPSTIWNRDFLIPPLLQVLAKQHGE